MRKFWQKKEKLDPRDQLNSLDKVALIAGHHALYACVLWGIDKISEWYVKRRDKKVAESLATDVSA
jgi:hypothetical protein